MHPEGDGVVVEEVADIGRRVADGLDQWEDSVEAFRRRSWGFVGRFRRRWWFWRRRIKRFVVRDMKAQNIRVAKQVLEEPLREINRCWYVITRRVIYCLIIFATYSGAAISSKTGAGIMGTSGA